jgi:hypothetical protein
MNTPENPQSHQERELEDILAIDAALAKPDRRMIPFEVTSAILDGANPIRAWREHRGMSHNALAKAARIETVRSGWRDSKPGRGRPLRVSCAGLPRRSGFRSTT